MKIGTQQIQQVIYEQLTRARADVPGGRNKFSKDLAKMIYSLFEGEEEMNKGWNLAHEFPQELELSVRRFEKLLGTLLKRTPEAQKIYEFVLEEEKQGRSFERFAKWATDQDRIKYLPKYFAKPEYIQVDWKQAFIQNQPAITRNADGSLNV